ncbi:MAG TPA: acyl-CoA synthetase [Pseudomonadales bacterium]|nr:acyl-CoA synthetase [Pseudomonadales bacterium]
MTWNYADIYEAVADVLPDDAPALIHKDTVTTWKELEYRANNLARSLLDAGLGYGDKVGFYLRNHSAYMEMLFATFKARLSHVNVNYRYIEDELWYILDNSDSRAVLFDAEFREQARALMPRLPEVKLWIQLEDEDDLLPGAVSYTQLAAEGDGARLGIEHSGADLLLLYTGGTTGMPKGVMWEQQSHWEAGARGATPATNMIPPATIAEHAENVRKAGPGRKSFPVCPQMHGTGLFTSIGALAQGGCIVTTNSVRFDPEETWQLVDTHKVNAMAIVGDAFAKPLLAVLDQDPGKYDISSLLMMISSGVMWSPEVKQGLLRHNQQLTLIDSFGASEAVGFGTSTTTAAGGQGIAKFVLNERTKVFTEDFKEVLPGSDTPGFVAKTGGIPSGYYKDPEKSAKTFPVIDGVRYSIPGDWCRVEADGTLTLLGRGSVCINTAGEKVYPEEVEEILKTHADVYDALVVGVPDEKWGQSVTGVVQLHEGREMDEAALRAHVHKSLAGYKCPKRVIAIDDIGRAQNGKADYKRITEYAKTSLGIV